MTDLQEDVERNFPSSEIDIVGLNEWGQESDNDLIPTISDLPWLQDVDSNQNDVSDVWYDQWQITYRDVVILNAANEASGVFNLTINDLGNPTNYETFRQMLVDVATANRVAESAWQNRVEPLDVSGDGFVASIDALRIINRLNTTGAGELPAPSGPVSSYVDVTGDNFASPLDALRVIRHLNRFSITGSGEPSEQTDVSAVAAALPTADESTEDAVVAADPNQEEPVAGLQASPAATSTEPDFAPAAAPVDEVFALDWPDTAADEELPLTL